MDYAILAVPLVIATLAYFNCWLTLDGAISGLFVGSIIITTGLHHAAALFTFFFLGTLASKIASRQTPRNRKIGPYDTDAKTGRNGLQVLATAGIPAILCLLQKQTEHNFNSLFFAYFATCLADTLASELGPLLSATDPILLTTLKRVPAGTDGAISFHGTIASLVGGSLIGLTAEMSLVNVMNFAILGFTGSMFDSLLGCIIQPVNSNKEPVTWKRYNTLVNLLSGILILLFSYFYDDVLQMPMMLMIAITLLYLAPIDVFVARKALHIITGLLINFALDVASPKLVLLVGVTVLPVLQLDVMKRFGDSKGMSLFTICVIFVVMSNYDTVSEAKKILAPLFFADPIAALVGRHFSTGTEGKTLYGAAAFVLTCAIILLITTDENDVLRVVTISGNLALVELLTGQYDNLFLTVFARLLLQPRAVHPVEAAIFIHSVVGVYGFTYTGAFQRFSRPHTVVGTSLSAITLYSVATSNSLLFDTKNLMNLLVLMCAGLPANIYIVGLNQIYDVEIDKINKPYLPIASGEYSQKYAHALVYTCLFCATLNSFYFGSATLCATVSLGNLLGTIYSAPLPFMHWKRFPLLAATLIFVVRGGIIQIGFYEYFRQVNVFASSDKFGAWYENTLILFMTIFFTTFGVAIAVFKDVPDIVGDKKEGIKTFAVRFGARKVVNITAGWLLTLYSISGIFWILQGEYPIGLVHFLVGCWVAKEVHGTITEGETAAGSIRGSYMNIWKAFYAEYLVVLLHLAVNVAQQKNK